jgi:hypothetical protein
MSRGMRYGPCIERVFGLSYSGVIRVMGPMHQA